MTVEWEEATVPFQPRTQKSPTNEVLASPVIIKNTLEPERVNDLHEFKDLPDLLQQIDDPEDYDSDDDDDDEYYEPSDSYAQVMKESDYYTVNTGEVIVQHAL